MMMVSFSKTPAALSRYLASEHIILFIVWVGHLVAAPFAYPPIGIGADDVFYSFYYIVQAYLIAFPLASRLLKKQQYAAYLLVALAVILAFSVVDEYFVETFIFGDSATVWFGAVYSASRAVTVILFVLTLKYFWRHHSAQRRIEQLARAKAEHELEYLKAQIHPHILFNELNTIYSHALKKSKETPSLILMLSDMLRYMIYDCAEDEIAIDREIEFLRNYIDLQRVALGDRAEVEFDVKGDTSEKTLPPFLLMPFVENAFKHSANSLERGIHIRLDVKIDTGVLTFICENNRDKAVANSNSSDSEAPCGVGLTNVRRRLELLFQKNYSLVVKDEPKSYHVVLRAPVR